MIYLDSSALLKLLIQEQESAALEGWITAQAGAPVVTSTLAKVEVLRACRRLNDEALPAATALLAELDLIPLTTDVLDQAAEVGGPLLRSLDALHLASALSIGSELAAFVCYDHRLLEAASAAGLAAVNPGGCVPVSS